MLLLRRFCSFRRVPVSLTSGTSGKHMHSHYLRQLHTTTSRNTGNASASTVFALAIGGVALGLGGYYVGRGIETPSPSPVYGTPEDFGHAIEELKMLFSKDTVTTDKDQLEAHGFSYNAHHPGTSYPSDLHLVLLTFELLWIGYPHSVVVYPDSTEDVVKIVSLARKYRMPIIPYSGGSSLEGHFAGVRNNLPHALPYGHFHRPFYLCSGKVGAYASICLVWIRSLQFMVCFSLQSAISAADPRNSAFYSEEDSDLVCQPGVGWMEINETLKAKGIPLFFPVRDKAEVFLSPWPSRPSIA